MRMRIKYQILLIAMIPVFLIDVLFTYVHVISSINQAEKLLQSKGEIIAQQIAGAAEFNLLSGNFDHIQHLLDQSIDTNDIIFLAVYDTEGNIIALIEGADYSSELSSEYSYHRQSIQTQDIDSEDIFQPDIKKSDNPMRNIGWVHMYISKQQLQKSKNQIFINAAIFFTVMLLIASLLTLTISQRITRPIYTLLSHLKLIETGKLGEIIKDIEKNEIGDVQKGFNSMSQALLANRMQLDQKIKTATLELMNAITNLEYNNHELAIARDNAEKADQIKSQFLANMSHEIRTPINGIKGFLNLLSNTGLNQDQTRYAEIITQSTNDLSHIVNEILDFSKIESGKIELLENPFNLYELVETTRDSLFASTLEKAIDLHLTIYSDTPKMLIGDEMRLKQVLINLIGNAIKFTDKGFVSITVLIEDDNEDQIIIKFNIEDSGIGISQDNQNSLFKAFKQIESDTNRRFSGTGLGLVISKNLARLMGGDILFSSEVGSGSLFTLLLPFKPVKHITSGPNLFENKTVMIYASDQRGLNEVQTLYNRVGFNTEIQLIDETTSVDYLQSQLKQNLNYIDLVVIDLRKILIQPSQFINKDIHQHCQLIIMHYDLSLIDSSEYPEYRFISVINSSNNLTKLLSDQDDLIHEPTIQNNEKAVDSKNILIVDDNAINLALASELSRLWGHIPKEAGNAKQAMTLFTAMEFDLILLDIQMPEIDGVELMQLMRKEQPLLTTPIVAITANVLEEERKRLISLGFNAYLSKPIDEKMLKGLLDCKEYSWEQTEDVTPVEKQNTPIDYELTLKLSANNVKLVKATFSMLQLEIPGYLDEIKHAIESQNMEGIASLFHKLHGITCYAGLPGLKKLLVEFETVKNSGPDKLLKVCNKISQELVRINGGIEQYMEEEAEIIS